MKYIKITSNGMDEFTEEFKNKEDAIKAAAYEINHMCREDIRRTAALYVLESANPDEDAPDHYDGDIIYNALER